MQPVQGPSTSSNTLDCGSKYISKQSGALQTHYCESVARRSVLCPLKLQGQCRTSVSPGLQTPLSLQRVSPFGRSFGPNRGKVVTALPGDRPRMHSLTGSLPDRLSWTHTQQPQASEKQLELWSGLIPQC